jgi:hypothetical protein
MPERRGWARAPDSPISGEGRVSRTPANATTGASNIVASADTRRYRLAREPSRIA